MKLCLICNAYQDDLHSECSTCGASPTKIDGFEAYAPDLAHSGGGFKASYFSELAALEEDNFWFRARNKAIVWVLDKYRPHFRSLLEIGCGTGFVLSGIADRFPDAKLTGSEIFVEGLGFAAKRLPSANLLQMDARHIPFKEEFDVVGAFDVLEHIKEDELVLDQVHKALKPNGLMLLSVPQHAWLWSTADEYALHERRYAAKEIHDKIVSAGFKIVRSTSFVTTLLPAMMISRALQKHRNHKFNPAAELKIAPWLNSLFAAMLDLEISGIKLGINFPVGGSRLVAAIKC